MAKKKQQHARPKAVRPETSKPLGFDVEFIPIDRVIPYARNARKGSAVGKVAASIKEFGWQQPIVVDADGVIIIGHTRLAAARTLGLELVPVRTARDLTPTQVKALRLVDNRTHDDAKWDDGLLRLEMRDLKDADFDLGITAFDAHELERLLSDTIPLADPTVAADAQHTERNMAILRFGGHEIPMTKAELEGLIARFDDYKKRSGVLLGFVSDLLGLPNIVEASGAPDVVVENED